MIRLIALALGLLLANSAQAQTFNLPLNQVEFDQQVSAENVSNFLFVSPKGALASFTAKVGASAGFVLLFDATTLPANGAVNMCTSVAAARPCLMWCVPVAANGYIDRQWNSPMNFTSGVLAAFSTTGCTTIAAPATAQFSGQAP